MSLQEALERVEKLKRLSQSSNEHEAALASLRLKSFDIDAARAPRAIEEEPDQDHPDEPEKMETTEKEIEILEAFPDIPYETLDELEAHQPSDKPHVNWDELHFTLLQMARKTGADALVGLQLKGTVNQKCLAGVAIRYLTAKDLFEIDQANSFEKEEEAIAMEAKERRDQDTAPGIG